VIHLKILFSAENGCFIKTKSGRKSPFGGGWLNLVANHNLSWKSSCLEMLNYVSVFTPNSQASIHDSLQFTERTPGSIIEERDASIVWRYWTGDLQEDSADRQWARRQAAEAQNHIFDSLGERRGLRIIPGKNSFLVLPGNISRSTAVGSILQPGGPANFSAAVRSDRKGALTQNYSYNTLASPTISISNAALRVDERGLGSEVDFVLVISSDEALLRRMNEIEGADAECVTVSTSKKGTDAHWKLDLDEGGPVAPSSDDDSELEASRVCGKVGTVVVDVLKRFAAMGDAKF
jgi:trehalose-6-phosphatase